MFFSKLRSIRAALCLGLGMMLPGCYRLSHQILDDENPETVFMSPAEAGGVTTRFKETVVVTSIFFGLVSWNQPDTGEVLARYYNTGKVQNLTITHGQSFVEGMISWLGLYGLLVSMRHVDYEGDVIRRLGG